MGDKLQTLSQAIRLGATFRPQCRSTLFQKCGPEDIRSCSIGAAYEASTGYVPEPDGVSGLMRPLDLYSVMDSLSKRFGVPISIINECWRLNDGRGEFEPHTREEVADWLESKGY